MLIIAYMTIHQNGEIGALRQYDMQDYRSEPRKETKELNGWSLSRDGDKVRCHMPSRRSLSCKRNSSG